MYVRDAKNREEVWLLDHIEEMGLDETAFRSRDYVVAIDEESHEKAGFGRIRIHKPDDGEDVCELTSIGVLDAWRDQGVGAHVVERLVEYASDEGFDTVYSLTGYADYLQQFGFERIDTSQLPEKLQQRLEEKRENLEPDAVPMRIDVDDFEMPADFRERFKGASAADEESADSIEGPEDFGIDPEEATYKYDTGR
jgi:N-acetylglutamate synthase-like GNAT family acetyltransferase